MRVEVNLKMEIALYLTLVNVKSNSRPYSERSSTCHGINACCDLLRLKTRASGFGQQMSDSDATLALSVGKVVNYDPLRSVQPLSDLYCHLLLKRHRGLPDTKATYFLQPFPFDSRLENCRVHNFRID